MSDIHSDKNIPKKIFAYLSNRNLLNWIPDAAYLKIFYYLVFHKRLNLNNPVTFNEKIQWLKLYDRKPIYTDLVDKYEVKEYVKSKIGEKYIIPTLGIWDSFDDINFDTLPDRFVLKCTHDSGGIVIVKDKSDIDKKKIKEKIEKFQKRTFYWFGREWPYKNVKPRIIAEEYMEDSTTHDLRDYKFFAFNGVVKALFIATDRQNSKTETKFDFFDVDFKHLPIKNGHPNAEILPEKPKSFEEMKRIAALLSEGVPEIRVDLYEANGNVYFGELTFSHWSGLMPFEPEEWDVVFGNWINLPTEI